MRSRAPAAGAAQRHRGDDDLGIAAQSRNGAGGGVVAQKDEPPSLHDGTAGGPAALPAGPLQGRRETRGIALAKQPFLDGKARFALRRERQMTGFGANCDGCAAALDNDVGLGSRAGQGKAAGNGEEHRPCGPTPARGRGR